MKRALILAFVSTSAIASSNYTQDAPPLPLFAQLYRAWGKYSATVREANIRLDRLGAKPFIYKAPPQIEAAKATVLALRTCRNPKCPATVTINDAIKALTLETGSIQSLLPAPPK